MLDEVIQTDYGQFDLVWADTGGFDGDVDRFFEGQVNGLVGSADSSGVYVNLARRSGGSSLRIVLRDDAPEADDSYQDVVEVSITIPPGAVVQWMSWAGETSGVLAEIPPGSYRLRVSARDRDEGASGECADGLVDAYMLEFGHHPSAPTPSSEWAPQTPSTGIVNGATVDSPRTHTHVDVAGSAVTPSGEFSSHTRPDQGGKPRSLTVCSG